MIYRIKKLLNKVLNILGYKIVKIKKEYKISDLNKINDFPHLASEKNKINDFKVVESKPNGSISIDMQSDEFDKEKPQMSLYIDYLKLA